MGILFLAPDAEMAEVARRVLRDSAERVEVTEALLSAALPVARRAEAEGVEVIVTRGGTALLLRAAGVKTPIVELPVAPEDMAQALAEAHRLAGEPRPNIGVVAFPNMTLGLEAFAPVLGLQIRCYPLAREEDAPEALEAALSDGAEVVLGGVITHRVATERGIPAALLHCGPDSFLQAFREARRIAYARRLEAQRTEELRAILDYAHEGILAVNREGRITVFNPVAERLTGVEARNAVGKPARDVVPEARLTEALASGRQEINELAAVGRARVLVSRVPTRVAGEVTGVVATLQDVTRIQQMEAKIRQEIHSKGHVARFRFSDLLGESAPLREAIELARGYAGTESAILLSGETGVGKELFAQGVHGESRRRHGAFVAVNCAALPEHLLESELFGYVEGAFTGARRGGKPGLFELAHGGSLFLDEVGEIPLSLQGRLLRVLQEREVMRLGHDRVVPVDVRVISATNRHLEELVAQGGFRPDLFYRLNVLNLRLPPLRERVADLPLLLRHFLYRHGGPTRYHITEGALVRLRAHPWPGNVRELENWCERLAAVLPGGGEVDAGAAERLLGAERRRPAGAFDALPDEVRRALEQTGGNLTRAAALLGVHRVTLWRRLKRRTPGG